MEIQPLDAYDHIRSVGAYQYRDSFVRLAWMITGSREAAEDVVHDVYERLARRGLGDLQDPAAFIRTMVVNRSRTVLRQRSRWTSLDVEPPVTDRPHDLALWSAVQGLSVKRRTAVVLRFYCDLSVEDAARVMRCRPGTVSSLVHRALRDLRGVLADEQF
jgi:RNA polymerase sigma factor (sigma-70 family)